MQLNRHQKKIYDEFDYPNKGNNLSYPILELISVVGGLSKFQMRNIDKSLDDITVGCLKNFLSQIAKILFVICEELGIRFEDLLK